MLNGLARYLALAGLSGSALLACSSDSTPDPGGTAGMPSGGSAAGTQTGGTSSNAGTTSTAGTMASSGTGGTGPSGGGGGAGGGTGGVAGGTGGASGGTGGGGGGGGAGGTGGAGAVPTAVAMITGPTVTGTATFTQGATMTKLVLNLTACPAGPHASHLHEFKMCEGNFTSAGGHWVPNGEGLAEYTCADNKGTLTAEKPIGTWTVGDGSATDVTKYSFMVHEGATGPRLGCGLIDKKP